jgi:AcrR family transcriptional regulator
MRNSEDLNPRRTSGARPGGRSERVVRDILAATAAELARSGYGKLGMDEIAAKAGVAKTTIYRRWPTKAELVTAAVRALHGLPPPEGAGADETAPAVAIDTGAVRSDLLALLRAQVAYTATPVGMGIVRVIGAELSDPEVEAIARDLRAERRAPMIAAVERGVARGELEATTDSALVVEVLAGTVFARLCRLREPIDDAFLEAIVDLVLNGVSRGAGPGAASPPTRTRSASG